MPNVLALSFEGFSFSSRQLYPQLLPKLLSRAALHESLTIQDALNYVSTGWPSIILVTDAVITRQVEDSSALLDAVVDYTKHGCTTIFMGFVAETVQRHRLDVIFKEYFQLRWRGAETAKHEANLLPVDECMIRTSSLPKAIDAEALFLSGVPSSQIVYGGISQNSAVAYAAFARVGLGKLGFVGDVNFGEEAERLILAMCHLDRPEDSL